MKPLSHGPKNPATNPYAVKTSPNILPKLTSPKQLDTRGADTANIAPKASPTQAANKDTTTRLVENMSRMYAEPDIKKHTISIF